MAKLTLADGTIIEGTPQELYDISKKFGVKSDEPLKVGDYAVVTSLSMSTGFRRSDVSLGDIGKIIEVDRSRVPYRFERQTDGFVTWFAEGRLTKATDEEVVEAKAQAKHNAIFTQSGRKPNEYRKGDIVRYIGSANVKGMLVDVVSDTYDGLTKIKYQKSVGHGTCTERSNAIEIVAFVENRLN